MCEQMIGYFKNMGQKIINGIKSTRVSKMTLDIFKVL